MKKAKSFVDKLLEPMLFLLFTAFAWIIMWGTFRSSPGTLEIGSRVWSDFAATFPLIRSFSLGNNFPPEYPIFAGPPIRYHFLFFFLVGNLEKLGIPIDWALNSLSILSFALLLLFIYLTGKAVFKSRFVGLLSVLLFLFNSSWGFVEFFRKNPISGNLINQITQNSTFTSFGPYDGKVVSAFWSLNIYTNQRHLAFAYASFLGILYFIYRWSKIPTSFSYTKAILLGIFIGIFPFIHLAVFGMMGIALITIIFLQPKLRKKMILAGSIAGAFAVGQILYMGSSSLETKLFNPGYLVRPLTLARFTSYWFYNLGITLLLAPIGFLLANKDQRKFLIPFIVLFFVGNIFQLSAEIAANHKFFNLFTIGANFFTALLLIKLWKKHLFGKLMFIPLLLSLTLTGIIDFFPVINDSFIPLKDIPGNKTAEFIVLNTPKNATFLNASFLYDPANIAGRKIYLGWPYFSWSAGYDTTKRHEVMKELLSSSSKTYICKTLSEENIDYIEIQKPTHLEEVEINYDYFSKNFTQIFFNSSDNITIYNVKSSCDF